MEHIDYKKAYEELEKKYDAARGLVALMMNEPTDMQVAFDNQKGDGWVRKREVARVLRDCWHFLRSKGVAGELARLGITEDLK